MQSWMFRRYTKTSFVTANFCSTSETWKMNQMLYEWPNALRKEHWLKGTLTTVSLYVGLRLGFFSQILIENTIVESINVLRSKKCFWYYWSFINVKREFFEALQIAQNVRIHIQILEGKSDRTKHWIIFIFGSTCLLCSVFAQEKVFTWLHWFAFLSKFSNVRK